MSFSKKIGYRSYSFQVEGRNLYELAAESGKISFPDVPKCGICESDNLVLSSHVAQEYKYTETVCLKCRAKVNFGQRKDDADTFFLRRNDDGKQDWKAYVAKEGDAPTMAKPPAKSTPASKAAPQKAATQSTGGYRDDAPPLTDSDLPF
jgi:hypothetical protein